MQLALSLLRRTRSLTRRHLVDGACGAFPAGTIIGQAAAHLHPAARPTAAYSTVAHGVWPADSRSARDRRSCRCVRLRTCRMAMPPPTPPPYVTQHGRRRPEPAPAAAATSRRARRPNRHTQQQQPHFPQQWRHLPRHFPWRRPLESPLPLTRSYRRLHHHPPPSTHHLHQWGCAAYT